MFDDASVEFWLQMLVYIVTISMFAGSMRVRIGELEKKQDKHNEIMKRVAKLEHESHVRMYRIKNIEASLRNIEKMMKDVERRTDE